MTALIHKLGVSEDIAFHDVYSIDDPSLLAFVPRPAYALLLVFPVSDTYEQARLKEDSSKPEYQGHGSTEPVIWYKQTISNACGLIGLLHGISNGPARAHIAPGSDMSKLLENAMPLKAEQRADLLYNSDALESAHQKAAQGGDTAAPGIDEDIDLHYVCFVKSEDGRLWELDGRRKGPIDRGQLDADDDVLSDKALDLGVRKFISQETAANSGESRFSLIALSGN